MKKVVIPRIGIRKVVGKAVDTKVGAGTDTAVSVVAKKTGDVLNFVGRKTGLNKLKIETPANKKARKERKNLNLSTQGKIVQSQKNLVEQEVRDIQSDKDWEKEKEEFIAIKLDYKAAFKRILVREKDRWLLTYKKHLLILHHKLQYFELGLCRYYQE